MITTNGQIIDINDTTEWVLFHRLSKKVHPVDFLSLTDSIIQFPNFLFTISYLILIFPNADLKVKFIVPASLYFCGQIMINLRFGAGVFRLLRIPLLYFRKVSLIILAGTVITSFFFLGNWTLMVIPTYLLAQFLSIMILTSSEKKYYRTVWKKHIGNYQIFRNNAFIMAYKFYAAEYKLTDNISPTDEEIRNKDWLKPYEFMRVHWGEIENHFNKKAKILWKLYLNI